MRPTFPPLAVFTSYAPADEELRNELDKHLATLKQDGLVRDFDHARVGPGEVWAAEITAKIEQATIILLLVSADYLSFQRCYEAELQQAITRHLQGEAKVIPIILRPCDWQRGIIAELQPLPANGKPITTWPDRDTALLEVATSLRLAINQIRSNRPLVNPEICEPRYRDAIKKALSEQVEDAYKRRRRLTASGMANEAVKINDEIIDLKRRLRDGGQLHCGDSLGDGRYLLLDQIGRGGFGTVWRAQDRKADRQVAVKVLHPNLSGDAIRYERFFRGARKMAEIEHPGIVPVLEKEGHEGPFHYFVMAFLPCGDLRRAVLSNKLPEAQAIPLILEIGDALAAAHRLGIVHRDIKPPNILLDNFGAPRLTDFDLVLAPDTTGGTFTGTLGSSIYSPPEMLEQPQEADARADVYGLGMTAIFCLHRADLPAAIMGDRARFLRRLVTDEKLRKVLKRAVDLKKSKRFADAAEFCAALRSAYYPPLYAEQGSKAYSPRRDEITAQFEAAHGDVEAENQLLREAMARARRRQGLE